MNYTTMTMDFDWPSALIRLSVNLSFIGLMILSTYRHFLLRRYSYTFLMISIIVYFLCYTLKNFDLNLGMALGLFAIFGIIRYRTEPLRTEEMTYLFITIGMSVINALSDEFLSLVALVWINFMVLFFIVIGEFILVRLPFRNDMHYLDQNSERRIALNIPYQMEGLSKKIDSEILLQEQNLNVKIKHHKIIKIDQNLGVVVVHLFY